MAVVAKVTGKPPPTLPVFPKEGATAWSAFSEMHRARQSGMAVNPIPFVEIDAWQRVTGIELDAWEVTAIRAIDDEFLKMQGSD